MADAGSAGIQRLLKAEEEAAAIISKAKKDKALRIKEAKQEAEAEIAAFRAKREAEFVEYKKKAMGGTGASSQELAFETEGQLSKIEEQARRTREEVTLSILKYITQVDITPPAH